MIQNIAERSTGRVVDERLYRLVRWEVSQRAWMKRSLGVVWGVLALGAISMAAAPFVLVSLALEKPQVLPSLLAGGGALALLPLCISLSYTLRIRRLRASL